MERDFMGLNFKESVAAVKEEDVSDGVKDSAPTKAPGSQWPFTNNVSAIPHFMHHISSQEDRANKTAASSVASSGFSQNFVGSHVKQSLAASIAGVADPRRNKSVGSPPQMTIFYNGTVKVYDSITPEKAHAIMFLAGNGSSLVTSAGAQARPLTPKFAATDVLPVNQLTNAQPSSTMSSPISVSSDNGTQSVSGSTCTDEMVNHKPSSIPFSPDCKMDPPKPIIAAKGSAAASSMIPRGIPQFRKVSLARFLEKRKERAMNAAPYNAGKKPECAT
ncbi:unnamed protein product [Rhodiola kirilowii]